MQRTVVKAAALPHNFRSISISHRRAPAINTPAGGAVFCQVEFGGGSGTPGVSHSDGAAHEIFADFYHLWDWCSDGAYDMCPY